MRKALVILFCVAAIAVPVANAAERVRAITVTKSVTSPLVDVSRWGQLQVKLEVKVTTKTVSGKRKKTWKVTAVDYPVYPNHTDRSAFISRQSLPLLRQELMQLSGNSIQLVSGATDTSYAFVDAVRAALTKAGA
jgi:uncharacterized protein with FMN-binding domain